MNESVQSFTSPMVLLIAATLFAILFAVILTTLKRAKVFPPTATATLAFCASLLALIGILRTFDGAQSGTGGATQSGGLHALLLPYRAMGISILLVLLLLFLRNVLPGRGMAVRPPKDGCCSAAREGEHRRSRGSSGPRRT